MAILPQLLWVLYNINIQYFTVLVENNQYEVILWHISEGWCI